MSADRKAVGAQSMPQLDFRQLFPDHEKEIIKPAKTGTPAPRDDRSGETAPEAPPQRWAGHLGLLGWANIAFVTLATLGGIACGFYFFNGTELLRTPTTWSREFLYPEPPPAIADIDVSNRQAAAAPEASSTARLNDAARDNAPPFNRSLGPRNSSTPAMPPGPAKPSPGAPSTSPERPNESSPSGERNNSSKDANSATQSAHQPVSKPESQEKNTTAARKRSISRRKSASKTTKKIFRRTKKIRPNSKVTSTLSANSTPRTAQKTGGTGAQSNAHGSVTSRTAAGIGGTRAGFGAASGGLRGFGGNVGGLMGHGGMGGGGRGR